MKLDDDQLKRIVAVWMAILGIIIAIISFAESEVAAQSERADRDTRTYALDTLGHKVSGTSQAQFAYNVAYQNWLEMEMLRREALSRGDNEAAGRYTTVRDQMLRLSPILTESYLDPEAGAADLTRFEVDTYLMKVTIISESYLAAKAFKDAWDEKGEGFSKSQKTLTLTMFLLGLSTTFSQRRTRLVMLGASVMMSLWAVTGSVSAALTPVSDLRRQGEAIQNYARGAGLMRQGRYQDAADQFTKAIDEAPKYAAAYALRAEAHAALKDLSKSIADYEKAKELDDSSISTRSGLAWAYYLDGQVQKSIEENNEILKDRPNELAVRYNLALGYLTVGNADKAREEYQTGMDYAAKTVLERRKNDKEPPASLWKTLDDAAFSIDELLKQVSGNSSPLAKAAAQPEIIKPTALALQKELKELAVNLEVYNRVPESPLAAKVSVFEYAAPPPTPLTEMEKLVLQIQEANQDAALAKNAVSPGNMALETVAQEVASVVAEAYESKASDIDTLNIALEDAPSFDETAWEDSYLPDADQFLPMLEPDSVADSDPFDAYNSYDWSAEFSTDLQDAYPGIFEYIDEDPFATSDETDPFGDGSSDLPTEEPFGDEFETTPDPFADPSEDPYANPTEDPYADPTPDPFDEPPTDEPPVDEPPTEEPPAEEPPVEGPPSEEPPVEEPPVEEPPVEEPPIEEPPIEEPPIEEPPVEEPPAEPSGNLSEGSAIAGLGSGKLAILTPVKTVRLMPFQGYLGQQISGSQFPTGTRLVRLIFKFDGMRDGQQMLVKVSINGREDPTWRQQMQWNQGSSGQYELQLAVKNSVAVFFSPGRYTVDLYVDGRLAQSGEFAIDRSN